MSNKKSNSDNFIIKSKFLFNDKYDYSNVNYINNKIKVELICKVHGSFLTRPDYHLSRLSGCPICGKINGGLENRNKNWLNDFISIHNDRYDYSKVDYIDNKTKVEIICKKHGSFLMKPNAHTTQKQGCYKCSRKYNNTETFIDVSKHTFLDKYDYSKSTYIKSHDKVEIICKKHGSFFMRPCDHINNKQGCPKCRLSKGEVEIMRYLNNKSIAYESQFIFNNCRDKSILPFDFYIPKYNLCIEFDGEQHYKPINYFGGQKSFENQIRRDYIKDTYCLDNKISLIRISYLDYDNISNILDLIFYI